MSQVDDACALFNTAPYYRMMGMVASSDAAGRARIVLPFDDRLTQCYDGIHGGALLSMADSAINLAVATTFAAGEVTATVDLTMQFLARAAKRELVADASVIRRGNRIAFVECVIRAGGDEVARAQGTCYISTGKR